MTFALNAVESPFARNISHIDDNRDLGIYIRLVRIFGPPKENVHPSGCN